MQVTAKLNYLRIAPRKTRLVADLIRRKKVEQAQTFLKFTTKRAAEPILKLLKSAVANAKNNFQLEEQNLYISKIMVDEGPKLKRWLPRARGRADEILKRVSHITIVLDEIRPAKKKKSTKPAKEIKKELKPETKEIEKEKESLSAKAGADKERVKEAPEKMKQRIRLREPAFAKATADRDKKKPKGLRGLKRIFKRKAF